MKCSNRACCKHKTNINYFWEIFKILVVWDFTRWAAPLIIKGGAFNFKGADNKLRGPATWNSRWQRGGEYRGSYLPSPSPFLTPHPYPCLHPHRGIIYNPHPQRGSGIPTGIRGFSALMN